MTQKKNPSATYSSLKGFHRAVPIILYAIAAFTLLCLLSVDMGIFGNAISNLFLGLFSYGAYALPLLLCLHAVFYPSDMAEHRMTSRIIFSLITVISIASLSYAITNWNNELVFNASAFYNAGKDHVGGGFVGGLVGFVLIKAFSKIGLIIITAATFAIYISYFFAKSDRSIYKVFIIFLRIIVVLCESVCEGIKKLFGKVKNVKSEKNKRVAEQKNSELTDDEFFGVDNGMQRLNIPELGIRETKNIHDLENKPTLQDKVFHKSSVSAEEAEEMEEIEMLERAAEMFAKDRAESNSNFDTQPIRRRIVNVNYGDLNTDVSKNNGTQDIIIEQSNEANESPAFTNVSEESADAIFTRDFDPFNMAMAEELASKPSSRSLLDDAPSDKTVKEDLSALTEAEIERMKRLEEFEQKKAAFMNARRATPVNNDGEFTGTPKNVDFRERGTEKLAPINEDSNIVSMRIEKTAEPPKAEPARYASIGGDDVYTDTREADRNAFTEPATIYFHEEPAEIVYETPLASTTRYEVPKAPVYEEAKSDSYEEAYTAPVYGTTASHTFNEAPKAPVYETVSNESAEMPDIPVYQVPSEPVYEEPAHEDPAYEEHTPIYYEEPLVPIFERKIPNEAPKAPVYEAPVQTYTPTVTEEDEPHNVTESVSTEIYVSTDDTAEETSDYVPEFKPYQPTSSAEAISEEISEIEEETEEPVSTLTIERSYVSDDDSSSYEAYAESEENDYASEDDSDIEEIDVDEEDAAEDEDDGGFNTTEIPPEEQNPIVQSYKDMFPALRDEEPEEAEDDSLDYQLVSPDEVEEDYTDSGYGDEEEDDDEPPFEANVAPTRDRASQKAKPEPKEEKKKPDYSNYKIPSIDFLGLDPEVDDDNSEITENTNILIDTLASFNVTASIKGVDRGPRITRYEVVPARGVKVQAITSLFNDITLNLAKEGVRMEAPIPGKSAVGFEIPNKAPKNVRLRELLECEEFIHAKSKTFVSIGKDVAGNPVFGDISKYPHALICGATGMGKSVCINSILVSMLYKARPDEVKFIMIDPKKVEFKIYSGIPHLLIPVITESKQAAGALMWAVEEMERRYELIEQNNIRNIEAYNEKVLADPSLGTPLPKIVIVIDELADLMMQVRDPVEDLIMRIAQKARAAGIHLIIGTQRPSVQVITGAIKANIPSRISCKVTSQVDSRTIFDVGGAEKLLNRGDMLYWPVDRTAPLRVQGAFVSDSEVESIMNFLKENGDGNQYDDDVMAEINKAAQKCGNNKKGGGVSADDLDDDDQECGYYSDQQFLDAVDLAIRSKKISTSLLQRKLSIGYGKAAKYIDAMEDIGVVSEPKGQKPRDVLITMDEWHEKLSRVDYD